LEQYLSLAKDQVGLRKRSLQRKNNIIIKTPRVIRNLNQGETAIALSGVIHREHAPTIEHHVGKVHLAIQIIVRMKLRTKSH
jgi:hypothetical protein